MRTTALLSCFLVLGALAAGEATSGPESPPRTTPRSALPDVTGQAAENDGVLVLEDVPPSPSTVPGERIWKPPAISHWPAVVYEDEQRNCAFRIELRHHGVAGSVAWDGGAPLGFMLPTDERIQSVSGLLDVPGTLGRHVATMRLGAQVHELPLRRVDVRQAWPHAGLVEGFPVDAEGVPVVLVTPRRDFDRERRYEIFKPELPRPTGRPLLVGDPLEALGATSWDGLDAERLPVDEIRYPHHAGLVALARLPDPLPRTLVWSPGNNVTTQRAWSPEETRFLEVLTSRFEYLGRRPRLVLVLPPVPVDEALGAESRTRREALGKMALRLEWTVVDVDEVCGPAVKANRVADGLFTRYPQGEAQAKLRQAIGDTLDR